MNIGDKVKYIGECKAFQGCEGIIVKFFDGFNSEDENNEPYWVPDAASVSCTKTPESWPYHDSNRFAPDLSELQVIAALNKGQE